MHQPIRLHPGREQFIWQDKNREIFQRLAQENYFPTVDILIEAVKEYPDFKFSWGMSGSFLEQAEQFKPELITKLKQLFESAQPGQIELLDESYYNSFAGLFKDPNKTEHREQVSMQRTKVREMFGIDPVSFKHTERMYNNDIAAIVGEMGLHVMVADLPKNQHDQIYRAKGSNVIVIPRDVDLSKVEPKRILGKPEEYGYLIANTHCNAIALGYSLRRIGDKQNRDFWKYVPKLLVEHPDIKLMNPSDILDLFKGKEIPELDIPGFSTATFKDWKQAKDYTNELILSQTELDFVKRVESLENTAREVGGAYLKNWRYLTAADNLKFLHQDLGRRNPYGTAVDAAYALTQKLSDLESSVIKQFHIIKERQKPTVLMIYGEPGEMPEEMGGLANYIRAQIGGIGIAVTSLIPGLKNRGWNVIPVIPNLKTRFQYEAGITTEQRRELLYSTDPGDIELVDSPVFEGLMSLYDGNQAVNAAAFQEPIAEGLIKRYKARVKGPLILHSHNALGGGLVVAKANARGIPVVETVHSAHTIYIPISLFRGFSEGVYEKLYLTPDKTHIDSLPTAVKNSWRTIMVSEGWLGDHLLWHFPDVIQEATRREVIEKHRHGAIDVVMNCIHSSSYPENSTYLRNPREYFKPEAAKWIKPFGPESDLIEIKKNFLRAFQIERELNVDPNAILILYCARADRYQKSIDWVEAQAQALVKHFADRKISVQYGIIANGVGKNYGERKIEEEILGRIAHASQGSIAYCNFTKAMESLGCGAAHLAIGPSRFAPCEQNDMMAILHGAFFVGTDTGGYHNKLEELRLTIDGATRDHGNGFKFWYDYDEFWKAQVRAVETVAEKLKPNPDYYSTQMQRIMNHARKEWSIDKMIAGTIATYEKCLRSMPG